VSRESGIGNRESNARSSRRRPIHEDLDAYRVSRSLAIELYRDTSRFTPDERFGLTSQIRRAAVSIPANIAEGAARRSKQEFARFLLTARGSAAELRLLLDIAHETGHLKEDRFREHRDVLDRVIAMTSGLIQRATRLAGAAAR
jgi:four helix bundle protein